MALQQAKGGGHHATQRDGGILVGIMAEGLLLKQATAQENGRQVDGVACHQVLGLDGGQHGVNPAQVARSLALYRGGLQPDINVELLWFRLRFLASRLAARRDDECESNDDGNEMPHEVSAHFAAKLRIFQHITLHFPFFILLFAHLALPLSCARRYSRSKVQKTFCTLLT